MFTINDVAMLSVIAFLAGASAGFGLTLGGLLRSGWTAQYLRRHYQTKAKTGSR